MNEGRLEERIEVGTVEVRLFLGLLRALKQVGMDTGRLLRRAGFSIEELWYPDRRITLPKVSAFWGVVGADSPMDIGLRAGVLIEPKDFGIVGYAMSFSSSIFAALARLERYGTVVEGMFRARLLKGKRSSFLALRPVLAGGPSIAMEFRLMAVLSILRQITSQNLVPLQVEVGFPRSSGLEVYREFFQCPLRFGRSRTGFRLSEADLNLPIPDGDEVLAGFLDDHALFLCSLPTRVISMAGKVRAAIWADFPGRTPTLAGIASRVGVSPRTLQRHLKSEGVTFGLVLREVRLGLAQEMLREGVLPIQKIAYILGYREVSTFHSSFKRWTGTTPQIFRRAGEPKRDRSGLSG